MNRHRIGIMLMMIILGLAFIAIATLIVDSANAAEPEREWFTFMMDRTTCIEIEASDFMHAQCALELIAKEKGYELAEVIDQCPGMLAENYYYDFTFKECLN